MPPSNNQFHLSSWPGLRLTSHKWLNWRATLVLTMQFDMQSHRLQNECMVQDDQRFLFRRSLRSLVLRVAVLAWTLFGTSDAGYKISCVQLRFGKDWQEALDIPLTASFLRLSMMPLVSNKILSSWCWWKLKYPGTLCPLGPWFGIVNLYFSTHIITFNIEQFIGRLI